MKTKVKLKIADIIIEMRSRFRLKQLSDREKKEQAPIRFKNFFYSGRQDPNIKIKVELVERLPATRKAKKLFITYHFQGNRENWRLLKSKRGYIYKSQPEYKKQLILVNKRFNRAVAYLLIEKDKEKVWSALDLIYDFLQVLLINYLALRNEGIFVHAVGLKDKDGRGLLFAGKSGVGKSTSARIWHRHSRGTVLNDDRIILRKPNGRFFIYGSPWHGEFGDYLDSRVGSAPLDKLFFIYHTSQNEVKRISSRRALSMLYPAVFPTFWDKKCLENIVSFAIDAVNNLSCYRLGFVNSKKVISFVRGIE